MHTDLCHAPGKRFQSVSKVTKSLSDMLSVCIKKEGKLVKQSSVPNTCFKCKFKPSLRLMLLLQFPCTQEDIN